MPIRLRNLLTLLIAAMLVACSSSTPRSAKTSDQPSHHVMVQIMDGYVTPSTARLEPGGTISWVNYTSTYGASILFPSKIKDALTCEGELRPSWSRVPGGIQSLPLSRGAAADDLELPCPLESGTFRYQVLLFRNLGLDGMQNPLVSLPATIVVE